MAESESPKRLRGSASLVDRLRRAATRSAAAVGAVTIVGLGLGEPDVARAQQRADRQTVGGQVAYGDDDSDQTTDYHEVRKGDTLWDLSRQYMGDAHRWPELWSYNPHITNPHWIYPGDIIYLEPAPEREEKKAPEEPRVEKPPDVEEGLRLSVGGFVVRERPEFVGRIVASPKEARLLGEFDSCWVGFGEEGYADKERDEMKDKNIRSMEDPGGVKKGDRFAIVTDHGKLTNDDGDVIGHKYLVLGSLVITEPHDEKLDTAYIDQSWREIERGAYLVPYERQLRMVEHVPAKKDLVATIVDSLRGTFDFGDFEYVFIDKGAEDGIRIGNRLYIYQRRAGLPKRWGSETPNEIPWRRVGRVRVVDVTENYATALITDSKREIAIGNRLEMYEGN